jgi:hypothetical protein
MLTNDALMWLNFHAGEITPKHFKRQKARLLNDDRAFFIPVCPDLIKSPGRPPGT